MPTATLQRPLYPTLQQRQQKGNIRPLLYRTLTVLAISGWLLIALAGGQALSVGKILWFYLCCICYLVLPGYALADCFAPKQQGFAGLFAAVYGCALLACLHCLSVRLQMLWLLRLIPLILVVAWLFWRVHCGSFDLRKTVQYFTTLSGSGICLFWAILCLLYAIRFGAINPYPTQAGSVHLDQDMLWNVGNAAALSAHFPAEDIRFSGVRLSYHYLTELLSAALGLVSGLELYDIYVFLAGPLFLAGELFSITALAHAYFGSQHPHASRKLLALLFGFSCLSLWKVFPHGLSIFGNTLLQHLITNINAQATALVFICGFTVSFILLSRAHFAPNGRTFLSQFVSFGLLCVAKGPEAAIIVCAFAVTMIFVLLFQKPNYFSAFFCTAGIIALFVVTYFMLFASGTNSMRLTIFAMNDYLCYQVLSPYADWLCAHLPISGYVWLFSIGLINVFCMIPTQFLLWLSDLPSTFRHLFQLDPARLMANGVVVGGFLAYHLFYHSSSSQVYFALVAMIYLSLLAVAPLERLYSSRRKVWRSFVYLVGAAALCSTVLMVGCYTAKGIHQLKATLGFAQADITSDYWTTGDAQAMQWLRENSTAEQHFATNRTSHTPEVLDAISNGYSALSGRPAYLEGWTYAMTNMGVDTDVIKAKIAVNNELFSACSLEQATILAKQENIHWLVLAKRWPGKAPVGMPSAFENNDVAIYELISQ